MGAILLPSMRFWSRYDHGQKGQWGCYKVEYNRAFKDFYPNTVCVKPMGLVQKLYNPYRIKNP